MPPYQWRRRRDTLCQNAVAAGAVGIFCLVVLAFAAPLLRTAVYALASGTEDPFSVGPILRTTAYTFAEALGSSLVALIVGMPAAFLVARRRFWGRRLLSSCAAVPVCMPPLIVALGYISVFGMAGSANRLAMALLHLTHPPFPFLYSMGGLIVTQGFYNFPLVMASVASIWSRLDERQAESARLLGASEGRIFWTVTLWQLMPGIVSALIPVFLFSFFSFMLVLLFGTVGAGTLELAVYHAGRSTLRFGRAGLLALIETVCALLIVMAYGAAEARSRRTTGISLSAGKPRPPRLSGREALIFLPYGVLLFLFFFLPFIEIARTAFFSPALPRLLHRAGFANAVWNTCRISCATAALCTISGLVFAVILRTADPLHKRQWLHTLPLLPMAVSSVVMGIGMTILVRQGTALTLIVAQAALSWPFAFRQIYAQLSTVPQTTVEAAYMLSRRRLDAIIRVLLPYGAQGIKSAFGFCLALSAGDASLPLVLAVPRLDTLALYTYRLAGSYRIQEACASGMALGILCCLAFCLTGTRKEPV